MKKWNRVIKLKAITVSAFAGLSGAAFAGPLNLADTALEVAPTVQNNIYILTDDSGSMDWGLMTDTDTGVYIYNNLVYYYTHPDGITQTSVYPDFNTASVAPAENIYEDAYLATRPSAGGDYTLSHAGLVSPTEEYAVSQGYNDTGLWRLWNSSYNKIYYNPNVTYAPWGGVDSSGAEYGDVSPTAAPLDPFDSSKGSLNLASNMSYWTFFPSTTGSWGNFQDDGTTVSYTRDGAVEVTNYYPSRYYEWTDSNNDGVVDSTDTHRLIEIRLSSLSCSAGATCPTTFSRPSSRTDCGDPDSIGVVTCSAEQELVNFANWFSYYRKRDLVAKSAMSQVLSEATTGRIGLAAINDSVTPLAVQPVNIAFDSGNKKTLLDTLFSVRPSGSTPLRVPYDQVGNYFKCTTTDEDILGNASSQALVTESDANNLCPLLQADYGGTCQQNYAIVMTDGFYNGLYSGVGNADSDNSSDFDGGAFADQIKDGLADLAMHYYENDLNTTLDDQVSPNVKDRERYPDAGGYPTDADGNYELLHQHIKTYGVAFGVTGDVSSMPTDPVAAFDDWPDPSPGASDTSADKNLVNTKQTVDDLLHAAYNGRGDFKSATDTSALVSSIQDIFEEIGQDEGAASAVAFNTQNIESGSLVFRAFFNTRLNTGSLLAQPVTTSGVLENQQTWEASSELDSLVSSSSDNRVVVTYKDTGTSSSEGVSFNYLNLTTTQQAALKSTVPASVSDQDQYAKDVIAWMRGQSGNEGESYAAGDLRVRPATEGKLGDLVHSAPVFYANPSFTGRANEPYPQNEYDALGNVVKGNAYSEFKDAYKNRDGIVYVGSNDGMLHAFDATTGVERFSYVPNIVFDTLAGSGDNKIADLSNPNYTHEFSVDGTPSVMDVYAKTTSASSRKWQTVLVGGMGAGGAGYYALNVTDPTTFDSEASMKANVMWEFTNQDDADLGLTFSQPRMVMTNAEYSDGEQRWMAIFGNGYNSTSASGDAVLYFLDIEGGLDGSWAGVGDYYKISTGNGIKESADGTTPNGISGINIIDWDSNGTADYIYAGDLQGNLYRFDISDSNPSNWDLDGVLFEAEYIDSGVSYPQPIANSPISVKHPDYGGLIVSFGTGTWMTEEDQTASSDPDDIQSVYGIWDPDPESSLSTVDKSELVKQEWINEVSKVGGLVVRTGSKNPVELNSKATGKTSRVMGWYVDLDIPAAGNSSTDPAEFPGERAVRRFLYREPFLFFSTLIPDSQSTCNPGAGGFLMGINPLTGAYEIDPDTSSTTVVFDLNNDGLFDDADNTSSDEVVTGYRFEGAMPSDSSMIGNTIVTQESDKSIDFMNTNTGVSSTEGRQSWREINYFEN